MHSREAFQAEMARVGIDEERSKAWADFLFDGTLTPENCATAQIPAGPIDADMLLLANRHQANPIALFITAKAFVTRLVPQPDSIDAWEQVISQLRAHTGLVSQRTKSDLAKIAQNTTFRQRLENAQNLSEWETQVACGELFDLLAVALSFMHRQRALDTPLVRAYNHMLRRLKTPLNSAAIEIEPGNAKMIITVHSRFRPEFVPPMRQKFEDHLYSVLAEKLVTTQQINAERIVMLKKLKRGISVMVAADGKKGNHNATGQVFDREAKISDGFAWVAWKAKCPVVWAFASLETQGAGLKAQARVLLPAPAPETDFETYATQLISAYFSAVEGAIIQHPFGFGLLYPKRIGDGRRAKLLKQGMD